GAIAPSQRRFGIVLFFITEQLPFFNPSLRSRQAGRVISGYFDRDCFGRYRALATTGWDCFAFSTFPGSSI
ncbi:MAG: hypothetical protein WCV56_07740, partial [Candidatus Omnitrophota bacterium]